MPTSSTLQICAAAGQAAIVGVADAAVRHRALHLPMAAMMSCSSGLGHVCCCWDWPAATVAVATVAAAGDDAASWNRCPRTDYADAFRGSDPDTAWREAGRAKRNGADGVMQSCVMSESTKNEKNKQTNYK